MTQPRLGAFLGVFTPTVLTILGVIMYLRLGWVVGQEGLLATLAIVALANSITLITTLSFSAVATNIRVGVGGAYYIISRSLGLEIGGAIGLPLWLSQVFSVTLYSFGLAEALRIVWPGVPVEPAAFVIVLAVAALAWKGAGLALKAQLPLMAFIAVSLVALAVGAIAGPEVDVAAGAAAADAAASPGFWVVFAVYFPAVTGIMAGLGLSGDLRDPARAIPRGAIAATLVGFGVYLLVPFLLSAAATREALLGDSLIWTRIAPLGALLVVPGLFGAIFSSAVGSILGAPRTLQALAMDHLAPAAFARTRKDGGEPRLGLIVSTAIALAAVLLGDLNAVAPVVSMFFLTIYGTVNLVAAMETLAGDPSWRPRIRIPWPVSLAGAVACAGVMFLVSPVAAVVAIALEGILYFLVASRERKADFGDVRRGTYEALIRWALHRLSRRPMTARNWRPHLLVFADEVERRLGLIRFGDWFSHRRGIVTVCELVEGELTDEGIAPEVRQGEVDAVLRREGILAFPEVDVVADVPSGIVDVAQANGLAGLTSNTILVGWPKEPERLAQFLAVIRVLTRIRMSALVGRVGERLPARLAVRGRRREIHIWWGGIERNGDLMVLLAWLLTRNDEWRGARIRVMSLATDEESRARTERDLGHMLADIRIAAEPRVTLLPPDRHVEDIISEESAEADVVFLGLAVPAKGEELAYAERLARLARGLDTVFFVKNGSAFTGELV